MIRRDLLRKVSPVILSAAVALTGLPTAALAADFSDEAVVVEESAEATEESAVEVEVQAEEAEAEPEIEEVSDAAVEEEAEEAEAVSAAAEDIFTSGADFTDAVGEETADYVYGTVNLSYADYFYGELNEVTENATMDLTAADKVEAAGYRADGMYDTITCATSSKSMRYGAAWGQANEDGTAELYGIKDVNIAVPKTLYDEATAAIAAGTSCSNKLLDIVQGMTVTETVPTEYKVLNGDGTLTAMKTEVTTDASWTATISTDTRWGDYLVEGSLGDSESSVTTSNLLGIVVTTSDGAKYGMLHSQNTWLKTYEFAFAVTEGFKEPHGNIIDYQRFSDMQGKTISKITYLIKDGADLEISGLSLLCKTQLDDGYGFTVNVAGDYTENGAEVQLSGILPSNSNYALTSVKFNGNVLTKGTDYTYVSVTDILFIKNTDNTSAGTYSLTYTDAAYEDIYTDVDVPSGLKEGDVVIKDNKLVVNSDLYTAAEYLAATTGAELDGTALSAGKHADANAAAKAVFNEDGTVNFDAQLSNAAVFTKGEGGVYEITLTSSAFPGVTGTVVQNGTLTLNASSKTLYVKKTAALKATTNMTGTVTWASSNTGVATVDANGKVTAVKAGTATITATLNGMTASCKITVKTPSITAKAAASTIYTKGKTSTTIKVTKNGVSGTAKFTSSNKKIATVNSKGKVTAKKAGTVKITVKVGSYKKTVTIKVKNPSLKLKKSSASIKVGKTTTIKATATPSGKITYKSSNKKVATVSSKGVVKGVKKGTAKITVTCNGVKKTFKVTVK